jgi:hypothetical protein
MADSTPAIEESVFAFILSVVASSPMPIFHALFILFSIFW